MYNLHIKHNWSIQPFSEDYNLASHTNYVVCVSFIHKWRGLQFKVDSERQIFFFWETFHGNFISLPEFLPEICCEGIVEEILFFILFWYSIIFLRWLPLSRVLVKTLTVNKPVMKNFLKNLSFGVDLNCRSRHSGIKLTHTIWVVWEARP